MLLSLAFWPGRTIFTQHKYLLQWRQVADHSMKEVYQVIKLLRRAGCFLLDVVLEGQGWICSGQAVAIFRLILENRASKSWARHNILSGGHGSFVHVHPFISLMWLSTKSLATLLWFSYWGITWFPKTFSTASGTSSTHWLCWCLRATGRSIHITMQTSWTTSMFSGFHETLKYMDLFIKD